MSDDMSKAIGDQLQLTMLQCKLAEVCDELKAIIPEFALETPIDEQNPWTRPATHVDRAVGSIDRLILHIRRSATRRHVTRRPGCNRKLGRRQRRKND